MFRFNFYLKKLKSEKGVALPTVIIVATVLIAMLVSILSLSEQQFKNSKMQLHLDYTYIVGDAAIERAFGYMQKYLADTTDDNTDQDVYFGVTYTAGPGQDMIYARAIKDKLFAKVKCITVSEGKLSANVYKMDVLDAVADPSGDEIKAMIYVVAKATSEDPAYPFGNKEIYAKGEFTLKKPSAGKFRPAAVNTIGDLYARGDMSSTIKGDVMVYGTTPEKPSQLQQEYYGGVYALDDAKLRIEGNAFVRNFIRTGKYMDYENPLDDSSLKVKDDNSNITIVNSAIAQCIQVFGKNDRIAVLKDAFTFDDVEMNGENSSIIINRSLFGLASGGFVIDPKTGKQAADDEGKFHDSSSGIVNSAPIHSINYTESMKSRIAINEGVFLNGGSWKVDDTTGLAIHPIEDGSTAWKKDLSDSTDLGMATYKTYDGNGNDYHNWIVDENIENKRGYGNLIQSLTEIPSNASETNINNWVSTSGLINDMNNLYNKKINSISNIGTIRGFCSNEIAANGSFYYLAKNEAGVYQETSLVRAIESDISQSYINYIDGMDEQSWKKYWTYFVNPTDYSDSIAYNITKTGSYKIPFENYCSTVQSALTEIKKKLLSAVQPFVKSVYKWDDSTTTVDEGAINHDIVQFQGDSAFGYIYQNLKNIKNKSGVILADTTSPQYNATTKEYTVKPTIPNQYYLIYNDDPEIDLVIDSAVNGVVFSLGKVVLKDKAYLKGFIIAAGRGYKDSATAGYLDGYAIQDAGHLPRIKADGANQDNLDKGYYAGVEFRGSIPKVGTETAVVEYGTNPETAFKDLMDKWQTGDVKSTLQSIFKN